MAIVTAKVNPALNATSVSLPDGSGGYLTYIARLSYSVDSSLVAITNAKGVHYLVEASGDGEALPIQSGGDASSSLTWYEGVGNPGPLLGKNGDRYLERNSDGTIAAFWTKEAGTWGDRQVFSALTTEDIQDLVAPLFNHASHTNITVSYDDSGNKILLTGAPASSGLATVALTSNLPSTSVAVGDVRYVRGRSVEGDGGGGLFRCTSITALQSSDDGGVNFVVGAQADGSRVRWTRDVQGPINVKWFGARGDYHATNNASRDDSAAFLAWSTYIKNQKVTNPYDGTGNQRGRQQHVGPPKYNLRILWDDVPDRKELGVRYAFLP
jgi:hypothetical protein